jgi:hypothetical protein
MLSRTLKHAAQLGTALALTFALAVPAQLMAQSATTAEISVAQAGPSTAVACTCCKCTECRINGRTGHQVYNQEAAAGQKGVSGDGPHACEDAGSCCSPTDGATPCRGCSSLAVAAVRALNLAARQNDVAALAKLVREVESTGVTVEINQARSAVQVVGCKNNIMAHIPLTTVQLASF